MSFGVLIVSEFADPRADPPTVHVSPQFYGDVGAVSKRCGKWVSMWNEKTNYTVTASIEGVCAE